MLANFEAVNKQGVLDKHCTIGSLDVKSLYPSLDVKFASAVVGEMFLESRVEVPEVDVQELGLYLAINRTQRQLADKGVLTFCPTRKHPRGKRPVMTGCAAEEAVEKRYKPWNEAQDGEPGPLEICLMGLFESSLEGDL